MRGSGPTRDPPLGGSGRPQRGGVEEQAGDPGQGGKSTDLRTNTIYTLGVFLQPQRSP